MTNRLTRIFEQLPKTKSFADVGCDHGYIAKMMVESGKCSDVTIADISAPSLKKAQDLLIDYIKEGKVKSVCCDGLKKVSPQTKTVLIAGMGGEEIIKILKDSSFLPKNLIVQPMKNVEKVRKSLFEMGYGIVKDFLFYDKKVYNLIVAKQGEKVDYYSEKEFIFGRDNLKNKSDDFKKYLKKEITLLSKYLKNITNEEEKNQFEKKLSLLNEVLNENK